MNVKAVMAVAMFTLVTALILPVFISASDGAQTQTYEIAEGSTVAVTERLSTEVVDVSTSGGNATVSVSNSDTLEASEQLLNETETKSYAVSGDTVNVTLQDAFDDGGTETARIDVEYSPYFGWNSGARVFFSNLGIVFAILGGIMILGLLSVATRW